MAQIKVKKIIITPKNTKRIKRKITISRVKVKK